MKSFTKKAALLLLTLMLSISSFANPTDPDTSSDPAAPIDSNLYLLLFFGIAYVIYFFAKRKNIKS